MISAPNSRSGAAAGKPANGALATRPVVAGDVLDDGRPAAQA
jgi:hypothetical protein